MGNSSEIWIRDLVKPIEEDLMSGAAELALRAIIIFQTIMKEKKAEKPEVLRSYLTEAAKQLVGVQPAMAPVFHLSNSVLIAIKDCQSSDELIEKCQSTLDEFEKTLCASAARIADLAYDLIEPGSVVFAYSFSSTVVSPLLNARSRGRYFRVACTESRPSLEGRKLASRLNSGGIEVIHTFDTAMGLILPACSVAFMGCDCMALPGVVNKVGSWMLSVGCRELKVPLYALSGTEKFVSEERLFEFEKHERPGSEVWEDAPREINVVNSQFDLVPFNLLSGLVTEKGILQEADIKELISNYAVHDSLKLETASS